VVYRAHDPELDRDVAVKLLSPSLDPRHDLWLVEEARAMARLSHPNVVRVYDAGTVAGAVFVAMELLTGGTLRAWNARSRSWSVVVARYVEAGRGLAAAHAIGLVHRDFKPDNVLLSREGRACVSDFGLASLAPRTEEDSADEQTTRSVGTPRYMAPEAHEGLELDAVADQFSFGAALFEALYGRPAFAGQTSDALAVAKADGRIAEPTGRVPHAVLTVLRRALDPDPNKRFASMDELLEALERVAGRGRRRRTALALTGLVTATAGLTAWAAQPSEPACDGARSDVARVWNDQRRQSIVDAAATISAPVASAMVDRSLAHLDAYTARWQQTQETVCLAGSDRVRAACLDLRLAAVDGLVTALEDLDASNLELVSAALWSLPDLDSCLRSEPPTPPHADTETLLALQRLRGPVLLGRFESSAGEMIRLRDQARDRGDLWSAAAAGADLCWVRSLQARPEPERVACESAVHDALRSGHDAAAARAWLRLMELESEQGRLEQATVFEGQAAALLQSLDDPRLLAALELARGAKVRSQNPKQALIHEERALSLAIEAYGTEEHPEVAKYMVQAALVRSQVTGDASIAELDRAREIIIATEGEASLALARAWSVASSQLPVPEDAVHAAEQAWTVTEQVAGPDAVRTQLALANLAMLRSEMQPHNANQALAELESAIAGLDRAGAGERAQRLAHALARALMLHQVGRSKEAVSACGDVTLEMEAFHGARTYMMAMTRAMCAEVYADQDQLERAHDELETSLAIVAETLGTGHPKHASTSEALANIRARLDDRSRTRGLGGDTLPNEPRQ